MTALFCRPLPFSIVSANQATLHPATNAGLNEPAYVWRSTSLNVGLVIDLGAGASYDTVALIGTNLRATDTIQISTGTTNTGTGSFFSGVVNAFTGTKPTAYTTKTVVKFPNVRTERYMRIDITATGHPDTYTSVQRLVVGKSVSTLGFDYGAEQSFIDPSAIQNVAGTDIIDQVATRPRWKISMSYVAASTWRQEWTNFLASVGKVVPILFVPNLEAPEDFQSEVIFGRIRNEATAKVTGNTLRQVELTIDALAP